MPAPAGTEPDHASSPRMSRALVARQVRGTKRVRLWHPSDAAAMYPGGGGSALFSRADPFDLDAATYPLLAQASRLLISSSKLYERPLPAPEEPRLGGRSCAGDAASSARRDRRGRHPLPAVRLVARGGVATWEAIRERLVLGQRGRGV